MLKAFRPIALRRKLGFSALFGALLISSACGNGPRTANVAGSWYWTETNLSVYPPVRTQLHVTLNQTTNTLSGTKLTPSGQSCAIAGTIENNRIRGTISSPCSQTFATTFTHLRQPKDDILAGWVSNGKTATLAVFAIRTHN